MDPRQDDGDNEPAHRSNGARRSSASQPRASVRSQRGCRLPKLVGAGLVVVILGLGTAFGVITQFARSDLPTLTAAELAQAERRWREAGVADYDMDIKVSGRQPSDFHVEVRGGKPVSLSRNGIAPRRGMWDVWTVPGLFDTLHQELEQASNPAGPFGSPPGTQVIERACFDERYGYVARYHRSVLGTPLEIAWEVARFTPHDANRERRGGQRPPAD